MVKKANMQMSLKVKGGDQIGQKAGVHLIDSMRYLKNWVLMLDFQEKNMMKQ